jgi:AraC family transcriptional regulator of adaptative response / DNA-3-methyladenine glycosylase II
MGSRVRLGAGDLPGSPSDEVVRSASPSGSAQVRLPYVPPLGVDRMLTFLGDRAIPGVEEVRERTYRRSISTPGGAVTIALAPGAEDVGLRIDGDDARGIAAAIDSGRRLLDLDVDPAAVARTLGRDPLLRPLVRSHRGVRVPGAADGFELVVRAILGQQVSVAGARTMLGRVASRFGTPLPSGVPDVVTLFPSAERLTDAPLEELGITSGRAGAIRRVATLVADGALDLSTSGDPDAAVDRLLEVSGIGPWTCEYVRMRAFGDRDAFPATDLGVRRAFERLGLDASPRAILDRAEAWRPWRAYAVLLLWSHDG